MGRWRRSRPPERRGSGACSAASVFTIGDPVVPTLEETLQRLATERDEADRRYNETLTALDRASIARLDTPDPAPPFDDQQIIGEILL